MNSFADNYDEICACCFAPIEKGKSIQTRENGRHFHQNCFNQVDNYYVRLEKQIAKGLESVSGLDKLSPADQKMIKEFIAIFLDTWEYPEEWHIQKVYRDVDGSGEHIHADFIREINGQKRKTWFHVMNRFTWF